MAGSIGGACTSAVQGGVSGVSYGTQALAGLSRHKAAPSFGGAFYSTTLHTLPLPGAYRHHRPLSPCERIAAQASKAWVANTGQARALRAVAEDNEATP
jgi:hypothetical protein